MNVPCMSGERRGLDVSIQANSYRFVFLLLLFYLCHANWTNLEIVISRVGTAKKKKNCVKLEFSQLCCFFNLSVYFCKNICALEKKFFIHSKWKSIRLIRIILKTFIMMFVLLCVDYDEKHCMKLQFVPQFS